MLLVSEVCDSTLRFDRKVKVPLYARYKVPEVWLLYLAKKRVEIYRNPGTSGYGQLLRPSAEERISPLLLSSLKLAPATLFAS